MNAFIIIEMALALNIKGHLLIPGWTTVEVVGQMLKKLGPFAKKYKEIK